MKTDGPMWAVVVFDLPVGSKTMRREATQYRKRLLQLGFTMIQLSVYSKYLINGGGFGWLGKQISADIPPGGAVRMFSVTDHAWSTMLRYVGRNAIPSEDQPQQLAIFGDWDVGKPPGEPAGLPTSPA